MATVTGFPDFSKYIDLKDGSQVGIHKFTVVRDGPYWNNTVRWDVRRLAPSTPVGGLLGTENQTTNISVTASGNPRVLASAVFSSATLNGYDAAAPEYTLYFATFHAGSSSSGSPLNA